VLVVGQDLPQVGAVDAERCGAVLYAVLLHLAHDGRQAVHDADRQSDEDLAVGLAGDLGQPAQGLLAAVPGLDLLAAQAVRPDCPQEPAVPGQALDVGFVLCVLLASSRQLYEVGEPEAGLSCVAARLVRGIGDQPLDRRGLVPGDPEGGLVAADSREVAVGARHPRRLLELQLDRPFHSHAVHPGTATAGRVRRGGRVRPWRLRLPRTRADLVDRDPVACRITGCGTSAVGRPLDPRARRRVHGPRHHVARPRRRHVPRWHP
jgi:hypothetical protein